MIKYLILGLYLILASNVWGQDTLSANKGNIWEEFSRVGFSQEQTIKNEHIKKWYCCQYENKNGKSKMAYRNIQWFDKQGRTTKEKIFDEANDLLEMIKFQWFSDSIVIATRYFPQKDSASRFLQYDKNNMELYEILLSNNYKSKYYTTKIKLILDKNMRCREYVYYDYKQNPFLHHFRFTWVSDYKEIIKSDTTIDNSLVKKIVCNNTYISKDTLNKGFKNTNISIFEYDEQKKVIEKKEIFISPKYMDTLITFYSYYPDNQIQNLIKKRRTDTTFYEKEEFFYNESRKLNRKIRIDNYGFALEDEYLTKKDTMIYKRYTRKKRSQIKQLEREEHTYQGRIFLAKYYEADSNDFWQTKTRYRKRIFWF